MRSRVIGSRAVSGARRGRAERGEADAAPAAAAPQPVRGGRGRRTGPGRRPAAVRRSAAGGGRCGAVPGRGPRRALPPASSRGRWQPLRCRSPERGYRHPGRAGRIDRGSLGASRRARWSVPIRVAFPCPPSRSPRPRGLSARLFVHPAEPPVERPPPGVRPHSGNELRPGDRARRVRHRDSGRRLREVGVATRRSSRWLALPPRRPRRRGAPSPRPAPALTCSFVATTPSLTARCTVLTTAPARASSTPAPAGVPPQLPAYRTRRCSSRPLPDGAIQWCGW